MRTRSPRPPQLIIALLAPMMALLFAASALGSARGLVEPEQRATWSASDLHVAPAAQPQTDRVGERVPPRRATPRANAAFALASLPAVSLTRNARVSIPPTSDSVVGDVIARGYDATAPPMPRL
jgi:hypothetical protein